MFQQFLKRQSYVFYVQVWPDRIKVTELNSLQFFDDLPLLSYENDGEEKIIRAVGAASQPLDGLQNIVTVSPFYKNDCVIADVDGAVAIINHALFTLTSELPRKMFSPLVIFHSMCEMENDLGVSDAEAKKLLAEKCGAREAIIMKSDEYIDLDNVR